MVMIKKIISINPDKYRLLREPIQYAQHIQIGVSNSDKGSIMEGIQGLQKINVATVTNPLSVLEVEIQSGETLTAKKGFDLEYSQGLFTDEAQENKFRPMASPLLPNEQTEKLIQGLRKLEEISDIGEVLNLSVPPT